MKERKPLFSVLKIKAIVFIFLIYPFQFHANEESLPELGDTSSSSISLASEYKLGRLWVAQLLSLIHI